MEYEFLAKETEYPKAGTCVKQDFLGVTGHDLGDKGTAYKLGSCEE